jgi:hypothetical protein
MRLPLVIEPARTIEPSAWTDLGYDDVAFHGNKVNADVTKSITAAAAEGIVLTRHYVHWHCSPSRRSFLTGRLPLHHSEFLSSIGTGDDIGAAAATDHHAALLACRALTDARSVRPCRCAMRQTSDGRASRRSSGRRATATIGLARGTLATSRTTTCRSSSASTSSLASSAAHRHALTCPGLEVIGWAWLDLAGLGWAGLGWA